MESRRQKGVALAQEILPRAAELFGRHGYNAVAMREIAEACGVSKPALYYHYDSKEALALALLEWGFDRVTEMLDRVLASKPATPVDAAAGILSEYIYADTDMRNWVGFMFPLLFVECDSAIFARIRELDKRTHERMFNIFQPFEDNGMLQPGCIHSLCAQLTGTFIMIFVAQLRDWCPKPVPQLLKEISSDIVFGVASADYTRAAHSDLGTLSRKFFLEMEQNS